MEQHSTTINGPAFPVEATIRERKPTAEELARDYWPEAYRVAVLALGDRGLAEDVAQETVMAAIARRDQLDLTRSLKAWIHRVAANRAIDRLRSAEMNRLMPVGSDEELELGASYGLPEVSDPELTAALLKLNPVDRVAVILRHVLDHPAADVAEALDLNPSTTRTRISRALTTLRDHLEDESDG